MESLNRLVRRWANEDVMPVAIPEPDEVRRTFADLGSTITPDVLAMYQAIGGMENMDGELFRIWPLAEVRSEQGQKSGAGILFADYLIGSWCYRVRPVDSARSAVYIDYFDHRGPLLVAESVEAFFDAYLADPTFLYSCG